ncbi:MAG: alpha/beta hydrolase [Clostridiales bacterium]|jgi:pimeloyl-ACP methyl ester carboxylesterase|nr:alpha/beta hydrolase [Clostridiales bacterium]
MNNDLFRDGIVSTEGDEIYYKVRGKGKPLLFIAPAGGNGDGYYPVAQELSNQYKVITYDRRANTRSTMNFPDYFDIRQQSRDAFAVLESVGEKSAIVIGNSSGAVIALDMATAFPEVLHAAIIHEAAVPNVLPEAESEKWEAFFQDCYSLAKRKGASHGAMKFYFGAELPAIRLMWDAMKVIKYMKQDKTTLDMKRIQSSKASNFLIFNELLPVTSYRPDFDALMRSGVKIYIGCGEYGLKKNTWYYRAAKIMASKLSCELVSFPGHHGEYMGRYKPWAKVLRETIQKTGW